MKREMIANRPCWLDQPLLVIPALELRVREGVWSARFMFPTSPTTLTSFSCVERNFKSFAGLTEFLADWERSPEDAVFDWFDRDPPRTLRPGENPPASPEEEKIAQTNAGDLGL